MGAARSLRAADDAAGRTATSVRRRVSLPILDSYAVVVTDSDGSTGNASLDIRVVDDVPTASAEPNENVAEGATVTGTLDFVPGADGATVTQVNGVALTFGPDGFSQVIDIGNGTDSFYEVVGVVGNVHEAGLERPPGPTMYVPYAMDTYSGMSIVARTPGEPATLSAAVRQTVASIDATLPAFALTPLTAVVSDSVAPRRFSMLLLVLFACIALFLAAVKRRSNAWHRGATWRTLSANRGGHQDGRRNFQTFQRL